MPNKFTQNIMQWTQSITNLKNNQIKKCSGKKHQVEIVGSHKLSPPCCNNYTGIRFKYIGKQQVHLHKLAMPLSLHIMQEYMTKMMNKILYYEYIQKNYHKVIRITDTKDNVHALPHIHTWPQPHTHTHSLSYQCFTCYDRSEEKTKVSKIHKHIAWTLPQNWLEKNIFQHFLLIET